MVFVLNKNSGILEKKTGCLECFFVRISGEISKRFHRVFYFVATMQPSFPSDIISEVIKLSVYTAILIDFDKIFGSTLIQYN